LCDGFSAIEVQMTSFLKSQAPEFLADTDSRGFFVAARSRNSERNSQGQLSLEAGLRDILTTRREVCRLVYVLEPAWAAFRVVPHLDQAQHRDARCCISLMGNGDD